MAAEEGEKSYVELTALLRYLMKQQVKFKWMEAMEDNFQELKARLGGDKVMVPYDPARETRVYTDSGPEGTQATVAQLYQHPKKGETWRPVHPTARAFTTLEKAYSQIEKESLGLYFKPGTSNPCNYGSRHPPTRAEGEGEAGARGGE